MKDSRNGWIAGLVFIVVLLAVPIWYFTRPAEAVERFRLWDEGIGCTVCALGDLGRALDVAGRADSARAVWERYLASTDLQRIEWDPYYLALARERARGP